MKEHLLSEGDRAALQGLIPLAGAVGAGTIFSLFAGGRRGAGTGFRVFEVFVIVAVLTAAALTAALSIDLLHAGQAISSRDLTQTAMPLVIATLLLVVISVYTRVNESLDRLLVLLPFVAVAIFAATELVISSWSINPGAAVWVVMLIFLAGIAVSGLGWAADRYRLRNHRQGQQRRMQRLVKLGYAPREIVLAPALPRIVGQSPTFTGWVQGERTLLDYDDAERVRDAVKGRWDALTDGDAIAATGDLILLDVHLEHWAQRRQGPGKLRVTLLEPGAKEPERTVEMIGNEHRLFDVSELVG